MTDFTADRVLVTVEAKLDSLSKGGPTAARVFDRSMTDVERSAARMESRVRTSAVRTAAAIETGAVRANAAQTVLQGGLVKSAARMLESGPAATALSVALGSVGTSATAATSGASAMAGVLGGPWGIALSAGLTLLGLFASKMLNAGDATSGTTAKLAGQISTVERLAQAYGNLAAQMNKTGGDTMQARGNAEITKRVAEGQLGSTTKERQRIEAARDAALKKFDSSAVVSGTRKNLEQFYSNILAPVQKREASLKAAVAAAELAGRGADERIAANYTRLNEKAGAGGAGGAAREAVGDAEANARLATATTAVQKAEAQLAITRREGAKDLKAKRITEAQYQEQIEAGRRSVSAAKDDQTKAAAAARAAGQIATAARTAEAKAQREAAKEVAEAQRELEQAIERIFDRFSSVTPEAKKYAAALDDIARASAALTPEQTEMFKNKALIEYIESTPGFKSMSSLLDVDGRSQRAAQDWIKAESDRMESNARIEEDAERLGEERIRNLSALYYDLFSGGTKNIWDTFKQMGFAVIAETLARFTISQFDGQPGGLSLGNAFSQALSLIKFDNGGTMKLGGRPGMDRNVLSLNNTPIAMVGRGETLNVGSTHASPRSGQTIISQHFHLDARGAVMTEDIYNYVNQTAQQAAIVAADAGHQRARADLKALTRRDL